MSGENPRFNPFLVKIFLIIALTLALLIPLHLVESLIAERTGLRATAMERVANGMGHSQRIGALMWVIPVTRTREVDGKFRSETKTYRVLASQAEVLGSVTSELRRSGIYTVPAFQAKLHIAGSISDESLLGELAAEEGVTKTISHASLFLAVSDPAGIRSLPGISVNDRLLPVAAATENGLQGVSAEVAAVDTARPLELKFSIDMEVSGTERLQFLPLAKSTRIHLSSPWPDPSFSGAFGPNPAPSVGALGFLAHWQVLEINLGFPQHWANDAVTGAELSNSAFGVDFYQPVDTYQRNYRSMHYAVLFIALSFMVLFLWEHTAGSPVHAMQYAMLGAALALFYLVLLALSEHVNFAAAYALAAAAMSSLLAIYFSGVGRSRRAGILTGVVAGTCYALMYLLVLSEDYALLFGALALFAVLSGIMIGTRKLDWYRLTAARERSRPL
jgi:inner membrane protein